jgi:predicted PurR-regulated permease PerM
LPGEAGTALSWAGSFFAGTVWITTSLFLVVFVGIYFAFAPDSYVNGLIQLLPIRARKRAEDILFLLGTTLRKWLIGQLVSMTVVGVLIGVGLYMLGVPLSLTLGVLAGILDFIPIVGPLLSSVPAILLGFLISPLHALYVVILYIIVNTFIESYLLVPLIQRYAVRLPPALALIVLVLMGRLFGFLGVLLATPLAAAALVLIKMVYVEDVLGDRSREHRVIGGTPIESQK